MITGIEVVRTSDDKLSEERWRFMWVEPYLVLDTYRQLSRASLRHKFTVMPGRFYCRFDRRDRTLELVNAPLPQDVKAEAYRSFIQLVQVVKERPGE